MPAIKLGTMRLLRICWSYNIWRKLARIALQLSINFVTFIFTFFPESIFTHGPFFVDYSKEKIITINKLLLLCALFLLACFITLLKWSLCKSLDIESNGFKIKLEYGDIFNKKDCKKVISFDECFTTEIGEAPHEIKKNSICGQFLLNKRCAKVRGFIHKYIEDNHLPHSPRSSKYNGKACFESGTIIPMNDFLLLAFAKLDNDGLARMTREEYLDSLKVLWKEIDKHHAQSDVAIPVLGSGITRFHDELLNQQQLVDIIIASYKLHSYKMKDHTLHIVCQKKEDFSLLKVGEYI